VQKLDKQSYTKEIINIKIKIVWNIFSIQITVYDVKFWWLNNFDALNFMLTPLSSFQYENDIFCFINMIFLKLPEIFMLHHKIFVVDEIAWNFLTLENLWYFSVHIDLRFLNNWLKEQQKNYACQEHSS
jgi:hypothetical protein